MWLAFISKPALSPKTLDTQSLHKDLSHRNTPSTPQWITKYMETENLSEKEEELLPIKRVREVS